jgi:hypothetical protein
MSNQEKRQQSVRASTGTAYSYEGDWMALFDSDGIASGVFTERMLAWINLQLSSAYTNVNDAMRAYAVSKGVSNWNELGTFALLTPFTPASLFDAGQQGGYFDVSVASSVWQDTAATTPATTGTTVARLDDLSGNGRNLLQSTSGSRPTLTISGDLAYLETDGAGDFMASAANMTLGPTPIYIGLALKRSNDTNAAMFGAMVNSTDFARVANFTGRLGTQTRIASLAIAQENALTGVASVNTTNRFVVLCRVSTGQSGIRLNGASEITAVNSWTGSENVASCGLGLGASSLTTSSNLAFQFYAGLVIEKSLSAGEIASLTTWLGTKVSLTL